MSTPATQTTFDAAIMAGGKPINFAPSLPNKTFIKIRGYPLFIHVLRTLVQVGRINRIYIVGPKADVERELAAQTDIDTRGKQVIVLEQSNNLVDNLVNAFVDSVDRYIPGVDPANPAVIDRAIVGAAGDSPIIIPEEVDQLLDRCDLVNYDYFPGMTTEKSMEKFLPHRGKPGISMAYTPFREGYLRISNIQMVKPFRIANRNEIHEIYKIRHLRKLKNIVRFGRELIDRKLTREEWTVWGKMFLAMKLQKGGFVGLADYFRKDAPMAVVENAASKLLGTRAKMVITDYGGCAVDVDHASNVRAIEENYDSWMALQREHTDSQ